VQDRRPDAQRLKRLDSAHAQEQLLANPDAGVSSIESRGELAIPLAVLGHVGVEQVQGRPPDLNAPDPRLERPDVAVDRDHQERVVREANLLQRKHRFIGGEVALLLPSVRVQALPEVPFIPEDADPDQRDAQVARRLQVVAREHAKTTRIDREALVETELHREVGHRPRPQGRRVGRAPAIVVLEVVVETPEGVVDPRVQSHLGGAALKRLGGDLLEEGDRVVPGVAPQVRVEVAEQVDDVGLPRPPKVPRQLPQAIHDLSLTRHGRFPANTDRNGRPRHGVRARGRTGR